MKILDRYILKKMLTAFFFVVFLLVLVICIINFTERAEDFIKKGLGLKDILQYYVNYAPYIGNLITPLTVFIATVFITAQLATHTEIIAMLSSGVSFMRLCVPYLIGATIISLISFALSGWIIPESNKSRVDFELKYFERQFFFSEQNVHIKIAPESYIYLQSYNSNADIGNVVTIETVDGSNVVNKLRAKSMRWVEETQRWELKDWTLHEFDGLEERFSHGEKLDTAINLTPKDFSNQYMQFETLNMSELDEKIEELYARGADDIKMYEIEKYMRYMSPFTAILLTFFGLIVSARKTRGGTGLQIAIGFFIAFTFLIFFILARSIAAAGTMNTILAVWLPNIVFSIFALALYRTLPR